MSVDEDMLYESLHESWDEIEELKAENTRLREQNYCLVKDDLLNWLTDATAYEQHEREREMQASTAKLQADNDKLRELVRKLYNMADFCRNCPDTERCEVEVEWLGCTVADPIDKLMEELGVKA